MAWTKRAAEIYRDYVTDGVPASGANPPNKADIRTWGLQVETGVDAVLSAKSFGAIGDGTTLDDTAMAAIAASGKAVYLPDTYLISAPIAPVANTKLLGPGTIKLAATYAGGANAISIAASDITVDGLTIDGNSLHDTGANLKAILNAIGTDTTARSNIRLRNLYIKNFSARGIYAVQPSGGARHTDWEVANCRVENCGWKAYELGWIDRLKLFGLGCKAIGSEGFYLLGSRNVAGAGLAMDQSSFPYRMFNGAGGNTTSTSTTSRALAVANGVTFAVTAGLGFVVGAGVLIAVGSTPTDQSQRMWGKITAYSAGTLTVDIVPGSVNGSGTFANWIITQWQGFGIFHSPWNQNLNITGISLNLNPLYMGDGIGIGESGATSTASNAIGTGTKTFASTTAPFGFLAGNEIKIYSRANPFTNYMLGTVTSWTPGTSTLVVNITQPFGSGTFTDWSMAEYPTNVRFSDGMIKDCQGYSLDLDTQVQYDSFKIDAPVGAGVAVTHDTGGPIFNASATRIEIRNPLLWGIEIANPLATHIAYENVTIQAKIYEEKGTKVAIGLDVLVTNAAFKNVQIDLDAEQTATPVNFRPGTPAPVDVRLSGAGLWKSYSNGNGGAFVAGSSAAGFTQFTTYTYANRWQQIGRTVRWHFSIAVTTKGSTGKLLSVPPVTAAAGYAYVGSARNVTTGALLNCEVNGAVMQLQTAALGDPIADGQTVSGYIEYETV